VFTAFSGSHQDAIRKCLARQSEQEPWDVAYLPIDPEDLGRRYEEVVRINSQSGKGGVLHVLERDFGITLPRWLQIDFSRVVQAEAEATGGEIPAARIRELFDAQYVNAAPQATLAGYDLRQDDRGVRAQVRLGDAGALSGEGHGAVEALVNALAREHGTRIEIEAFDELALGEGTDARAMACVRLRAGGVPSIAVAFARDTTGATLQAVLTAAARVRGNSPSKRSEAARASEGKASVSSRP
jgi:2-isopropylmalate synthase